MKIPRKNEFSNLKHLKNNYMTIIKIDKDESKSLSVNKNHNERNGQSYALSKQGNKIKTFNKLFNSNPQCISPITYKSAKHKGSIVPKKISRDSKRNINNNFPHSIRSNSNKH